MERPYGCSRNKGYKSTPSLKPVILTIHKRENVSFRRSLDVIYVILNFFWFLENTLPGMGTKRKYIWFISSYTLNKENTVVKPYHPHRQRL